MGVSVSSTDSFVRKFFALFLFTFITFAPTRQFLYLSIKVGNIIFVLFNFEFFVFFERERFGDFVAYVACIAEYVSLIKFQKGIQLCYPVFHIHHNPTPGLHLRKIKIHRNYPIEMVEQSW